MKQLNIITTMIGILMLMISVIDVLVLFPAVKQMLKFNFHFAYYIYIIAADV